MDMLARDLSEQPSRLLGEAIVRIWSSLPHQLQHRLFEDAIAHNDERMRAQLAIYLHDRHPRTHAAMKARAMLEPDSLGG